MDLSTCLKGLSRLSHIENDYHRGLSMLKFMRNKIGILIVACIFIVLIVGCSHFNKYAPEPSKVNGNLCITNYDYMGNPRDIYFSGIPHHVIAARPEILDALMALHAEENVYAVYITRDQINKIPILQKQMPWCKFYTNELDRETALMLQPDFIIGWRRNFRKGALGNIDFWNDRNIPVYIEENSGPVPAVDPFPPSTVESEIQFLRHMGTIFNKDYEAQILINDIQNTLEETRKEAKKNGAKKVLTIEFLGDKIETFGDKLLSGDIIRQLGCSNYNYETPFITREQFRMSNADTIFIIYHGNEIEAQNVLKQLSAPEFMDIPAVKKKKIHFLPYRYVCASNIYTSQCIREIFKGIYG